jgi:hypothetical protein
VPHSVPLHGKLEWALSFSGDRSPGSPTTDLAIFLDFRRRRAIVEALKTMMEAVGRRCQGPCSVGDIDQCSAPLRKGGPCGMTVLHSGSNPRYSENWMKAFGKPKPERPAKSGKKKAAKKSAKKR